MSVALLFNVHLHRYHKILYCSLYFFLRSFRFKYFILSRLRIVKTEGGACCEWWMKQHKEREREKAKLKSKERKRRRRIRKGCALQNVSRGVKRKIILYIGMWCHK